jgi:hypothetical protein
MGWAIDRGLRLSQGAVKVTGQTLHHDFFAPCESRFRELSAVTATRYRPAKTSTGTPYAKQALRKTDSTEFRS